MAGPVLKKKIIFILEAGDVFPSGYVRGLIYKDLLEKNGYEVRYVSRLPVCLLRMELGIRRIFPAALSTLLERVIRDLQNIIAFFKEAYLVRACGGYDIVYMSKIMEYRLVKKIRESTKAYLIYDFGDALWLKKHVNLGGMLSAVDAVTTDSEYTASYVRDFNRNCTIVPDSPQIEEFDKRRNEAVKGSAQNLTLGWIGSPSSLYNLRLIYPALERVFSKNPRLGIKILGSGYNAKLPEFFKNIKCSLVPVYDRDTMVKEVLSMDIGLFPLYNDALSISHGILKAAIYMSGEAAVISSPVGQCNDLIQDGVNGMLAATDAEWVRKLDTLIRDENLRKRIASNGCNGIRAKYSLVQSFRILSDVLRRAAETHR